MFGINYYLKATKQLLSKKKPKIAVCFFGHLRTYKICAPFLKLKFLRYYDYDLFMHSWSEIDHNTKSWHKVRKAIGAVDKQDVINTYGEFKELIIEEQIYEDLGHLGYPTTFDVFGVKAAFIARYKVAMACKKYAQKHNITYDWVLFIRPDVFLKKPLLLDEAAFPCYTAIDKTIFCANSWNINDYRYYARATDVLFYAKMHTIYSFMEATEETLNRIDGFYSKNYMPEYSFDEQMIISKLFYKYLSYYNINTPKAWAIKRQRKIRKINLFNNKRL